MDNLRNRAGLLAGVAAMLALGGCTTMNDTGRPDVLATAALPEASGVFATPSTLAFQAPDFTQIQTGDFMPGFEEGMAIHSAEVAAIANNRARPDFENTIVALEDSGEMLGRVSTVFFALTGADTTDALDAIENEISPRLSAHYDAIYLNDNLFQKVKDVYDRRATMNLDTDDAALLQETYDQFVHAGAMLSPADKEALKDINTQVSTLTTQFGQMVTAGTNDATLFVTDAASLAGMSDAQLAAAAKAASDRGRAGQYALVLQNTTQQPQLSSLADRETRRALFERSVNRNSLGDANDTRNIVLQLARLRAQKAGLFGERNFAEWQMYDRMVESPEAAVEFMRGLAPATAQAQAREAAALEAMIKSEGGSFAVEPWDWNYYSEKVRKAKYDLDETEIKPYFEMTRVLEDGVFYAANQLYGLNFRRRDDMPVYNTDVSVYTVFDRDGSELGLFYFDPYQRDSKRGGAWMSNFVDQSHRDETKPVIYNVLNIPKPAAGEPTLVSFDEVETMFHEFGHALHGFFADQRYASMSGTAVARDFVEFPSQANEKWATEPRILANYAKHYQTGAPIPQDLLVKIDRASKFNQGFALGETLAAAMLDMDWHLLVPAQVPSDMDAFETRALKATGLHAGKVPPRYKSPYFRHVFGGSSYSAGYHAYLWTEMLAHNVNEWFDKNGGLTRANGDRYRDVILSRGGTLDYGDAFRTLTGHDPKVEPLLNARGLAGDVQ
ncbi:M3 family metallopeptidase [Croceicoccus sp. F390]|uniref:M3 family metallopeptidase n=1 Tax=Croceicoccus esteveae TaxID=3075597 RepID=A0ABU2ZFS5_9SPHN|nr:M3 family metallopeptidase [Croceicoccus sp. F390]MDT0575149.1 M3 family metallopeptidase [Croceicoccus sp. F390]